MIDFVFTFNFQKYMLDREVKEKLSERVVLSRPFLCPRLRYEKVATRAVESESLKVGKSLKVRKSLHVKNRIKTT